MDDLSARVQIYVAKTDQAIGETRQLLDRLVVGMEMSNERLRATRALIDDSLKLLRSPAAADATTNGLSHDEASPGPDSPSVPLPESPESNCS